MGTATSPWALCEGAGIRFWAKAGVAEARSRKIDLCMTAPSGRKPGMLAKFDEESVN
jgi:hypothetical protein